MEEFEKQFGKVELPKPVVTLDELREGCAGDEDLVELLNEMAGHFYEYTDILLRYNILLNQKDSPETAEALALLQDERSIKHDAMISSVNILARNMGSRGRDNSWIEKINVKSRVSYSSLALMNTYRELMKQENNKKREEDNDTGNESSNT